uniref:Odorant-binding protein OBP6.2 n=1 Tax=Lobesia botrana TaxID=209534 RepID=A0A345BEQ1_9NEOP|nr:odorant-binding protein OBP6.2 [Lobesia botrana]
MSRFPLLLLAACVLGLGYVQAESDEDKEIHEAMVPIIAECSKEHGANPEDVIASKKNKDFEAVDGCLIECVFKKMGFMDNDGAFVPEKFAENAKKFFKKDGDSDKIEEIGKNCVSVNEHNAEDKCAKSKLLLTCLMEQKDALHL